MPSDQHFIGEVGQKAFMVREGKVLMVNAVGETGWDFPGGRLHAGEEPHVGLLRELKEELGIMGADIGRPPHTFLVNPKNGDERFMVVYECTVPDEVTFDLKADEIAEIKWVGKDEVETLEVPPKWRNVLRAHFSVLA